MAIIIQKFGGTSVKDNERLREVANQVVKRKRLGDKIVVILSAPGGFTDKLLKQAYDLNSNPSMRELDMLLSTGEQISVALFAMAVEALGEKAISFNATQLEIETCGTFNSAQIIGINREKIDEAFDKDKIVVITGFQGVDNQGNITTLGRGGSDTTAVAIGSSLSADMVEIYTDVDGIYTADPRIVKSAKKLDKIGYEEMIELAGNGAKVLHSRSVEIAYKYNIKIHLRSSFTWEEGTIVG